MAFEWNRIHKSEEYLERIINELVFEQVTEHYAVDSIEELTRDQINELEHFRNDVLNEYSPLQIGFSDVIQMWESENWE
jgi:hypothetical protein